MGILKSLRSAVVRLFGGRLKEDSILSNDDEREPDAHLYRPLGRRGFRTAFRDLRPALQQEQNRQSFKAFLENPFIRRLAKMTAEFVVGNGVGVKSKNEQVQAELDAWWNDPVNDMDRRHFILALELGLYGELMLERVLNRFTGRHRYNALDPLFAAMVEPHPKFPTVPARIGFWSAEAGGGGLIHASILNGVPEGPMLAGLDSLEAKPVVFYFAANRLSGALRGHSNFYPLLEWADVLDNAAFTMGERMVIMLTYVWHLKAQNLDAETKRDLRQKLEQANPGSAILTNPDVSLEAVTPDLKAADFTEGAKFLRTILSGAAGVPEHFMGDGGDTNLATAKAMSLPTLRAFLQQQREFVNVIRTLARANLESVARHGRIPVSEIDNFTVQVDPMSPQDVTSTASALAQLVGALSAAKLEGWIGDGEAAQAVRNVVGGIVELEDEPPLENGGGPPMPANVSAALDRLRRAMGGGEDDGDTLAPPRNGSLSAAPGA